MLKWFYRFALVLLMGRSGMGMAMGQVADFTLDNYLFFPWNDALPCDTVRLKLEGNHLEGGGVKSWLARPYLEASSCGDGWAGLLMRGDQRAMGPVVVGGRVVRLDETLRGVVVVGNHVVGLREDGLLALDGAGNKVWGNGAILGTQLFAGRNGQVWVRELAQGRAWCLGPDGRVLQQLHVGREVEAIVNAEGKLCLRTVEGLRCVGADGKEEYWGTRPWPQFARPVHLGTGQYIYADSGRLVVVNPKERYVLPALSAGLDDEEKPFLSGYDAEKGVYLLRKGKGVSYVGVPSGEGDGPWYAVAVWRHGTWIRNRSEALFVDGEGTVQERVTLTEESLEKEVFPVSWDLKGVVADADGVMYLSCSGPTGLAVLRLQQGNW